MIDIHSHLLPGVDDGAKTVDVSVSVLDRFSQEGVELVVCTPHLNASAAERAPYDRHQELLRELIARAPATPQLRLGWEIMLDVPGADLRSPRLSLDGSSAVLVEFPRRGLPPQAGAELARLSASGVVPVVAHPERYRGCTTRLVRAWRDVGAVIQVDGGMMRHRSAAGELARELLRLGLVDCLASDNHGDKRGLAAAREWLVSTGAGEQADVLLRVNPTRLLASQPVVAVAPIRRARGVWPRLWDILRGTRR